MSERYEGGCSCGAVRYKVTGSPLRVVCCHCTLCQRQSGGPMMSYAAFRGEGFEIARGEPKAFASTADGRRNFCARCGSALFFQRPSNPGIYAVTLSSLDDARALRPTLHIWTHSAVEWLALPDGVKTTPKAP